VDVFTALADPVRRDLLIRLTDGPVRAGDLGDRHFISRPAVSRHLRVLREAGLVDADLVGRERFYHLDRAGLEPVLALLEDLSAGARAEPGQGRTPDRPYATREARRAPRGPEDRAHAARR